MTKTTEGLLNPDMPEEELLLHMGEMTTQEMRTARAAIRWANSKAEQENAKLRELVKQKDEALEFLLAEYSSAMSSEFDFPNDPWSERPDEARDRTKEALAKIIDEMED